MDIVGADKAVPHDEDANNDHQLSENTTEVNKHKEEDMDIVGADKALPHDEDANNDCQLPENTTEVSKHTEEESNANAQISGKTTEITQPAQMAETITEASKHTEEYIVSAETTIAQDEEINTDPSKPEKTTEKSPLEEDGLNTDDTGNVFPQGEAPSCELHLSANATLLKPPNNDGDCKNIVGADMPISQEEASNNDPQMPEETTELSPPKEEGVNTLGEVPNTNTEIPVKTTRTRLSPIKGESMDIGDADSGIAQEGVNTVDANVAQVEVSNTNIDIPSINGMGKGSTSPQSEFNLEGSQRLKRKKSRKTHPQAKSGSKPMHGMPYNAIKQYLVDKNHSTDEKEMSPGHDAETNNNNIGHAPVSQPEESNIRMNANKIVSSGHNLEGMNNEIQDIPTNALRLSHDIVMCNPDNVTNSDGHHFSSNESPMRETEETLKANTCIIGNALQCTTEWKSKGPVVDDANINATQKDREDKSDDVSDENIYQAGNEKSTSQSGDRDSLQFDNNKNNSGSMPFPGINIKQTRDGENNMCLTGDETAAQTQVLPEEATQEQHDPKNKVEEGCTKRKNKKRKINKGKYDEDLDLDSIDQWSMEEYRLRHQEFLKVDLINETTPYVPETKEKKKRKKKSISSSGLKSDTTDTQSSQSSEGCGDEDTILEITRTLSGQSSEGTGDEDSILEINVSENKEEEQKKKKKKKKKKMRNSDP